jgi:NodT family efflux transporter outer membrane factor (OMF) lipoprotein
MGYALHKRSSRPGGLTLRGLCVLVLMLAGCAVGPDYTPVAPDAPPQWHSDLIGGLHAGPFDPQHLGTWWSSLEDATLNTLIDQALKGSLDLKNALARVREARALRGLSRAGYFPTLDAGASATKYRTSADTGLGREGELYAAAFDAGWEIDLFGGVRRSVEAAQASLEATQENLRDVLVSLVAEVALNYVEVRTFQVRIAVAEKNVAIQEESYALTRSRYEAGMIGELAVQQSLYSLENTRALLPRLQTALAAAQNRLAVLLGRKPGGLDPAVSDPRAIPTPPAEVVVGIPAEALRQRPDIRRAERNLAAQTARIGVATADLYPRLRLGGTIGMESFESGDLFEWANRFYRFGPSISWPIFNAGAVRRNIEVQSARQEQALIFYQAAVLNALAEVENALTAYAQEQMRLESLSAAAEAAQRAYQLADEQYRAGLVSFNNVLDAQRSLQVLQDDLAAGYGALTSHLVRLYKAMGGGWQTVAAMDAPSAPAQ